MNGRIPVRRVKAAAAARYVLVRMDAALRRTGACAVILSGGESPRPVYLELGALLAARVSPPSISFFLGDERVAERGSGERNETMVRENLFRDFKPGEENLFFWDALPAPPGESAARYAKTIDECFLRRGAAPDIALLGLGTDGHTASLFPGAGALVDGAMRPLSADLPGPAFAVFVPGKNLWRLSLSAPFLRSSGETIFLVGGGDKDEAIERLARRDASVPAAWAAREVGGAVIFRLSE